MLGDASAARETTVLPGVTQQLWIEASPDEAAAAGAFTGSVALTSDAGALNLPVAITIFQTVFPQAPTMHFSGFDWADGEDDERYGVTATNSAAYIDYLRSRYVDIPWAHRYVMMFGMSPLKTTPMRKWLASWPDSRRYRVFLHTSKGFGDFMPTDDGFSQAVQAWARAWAEEIRSNGKQPEQFDLLLLDEPYTEEKARVTELWARAIRESGAGMKIWTDPIWDDPAMTPPGLIDVADTISINLGVAERSGAAYWQWARQLTAQGKNVEIYACEPSVRRLDPYAYYRLVAWRAFFTGATAVSFWSFSSIGKSRSDNEFAVGSDPTRPINYSPLFINGDQIRPGKHMEAAAVGIQDAEYLEMLRNLARTHSNSGVRARATEFLQGAERFIDATPPLSLSHWRALSEYSEADRQRIEIGRFLDTTGS